MAPGVLGRRSQLRGSQGKCSQLQGPSGRFLGGASCGGPRRSSQLRRSSERFRRCRRWLWLRASWAGGVSSGGPRQVQPAAGSGRLAGQLRASWAEPAAGVPGQAQQPAPGSGPGRASSEQGRRSQLWGSQGRRSQLREVGRASSGYQIYNCVLMMFERLGAPEFGQSRSVKGTVRKPKQPGALLFTPPQTRGCTFDSTVVVLKLKGSPWQVKARINAEQRKNAN